MNWKHVSETRYACLQACIIGAACNILIVFLQSIFGAFNAIIGSLWLWLAILILPLLLCIWISVSQNRYPSKLTNYPIHFSLVSGTWTYFIMIILTKLSERIATTGHLSIVNYLHQSYYWLIPYELIIIFGYIMIFYREGTILQFDEKAVYDFAIKKSISNKNSGNIFKKECFELVANNDVLELFQKLNAQISILRPTEVKQLTLLEGQFNAILQQKAFGTVTENSSRVELNRIALSLLNLAEDLGKRL